MALPFGVDLVGFLADRRHPALTPVFQLFTFLGEAEGYVLVVTLVYVAFDKRLAIRLAVLALAAMCLNHVLKTIVAIPRPFVAEGTWAERWAVSPAKAADLATEFSTPSGHAMAGGAFWGYLGGRARRPAARAACVAVVLGVGLSRPYLGVHYLEDVLLGWILGGSVALLALRRGDPIARRWAALSHARQVALALVASAIPWLATRALAEWSAEGQPTAFIGYAGFLTGIVIARPLETRLVDFDPRRGTLAQKALRWVAAVAMVLGTLAALDTAFEALARDATPLGDLLRYLRYAAAAVVAMLLAPLAFVKLGWVEREQAGPLL